MRDFENQQQRRRNPHGSDKQVVDLTNFEAGHITVHKYIMQGILPPQVAAIEIKAGQNKLSLVGSFKGVVCGTPKDKTKKYQIEFVGFTNEEVKEFKEKEKLVNNRIN